MTAQTSPPTPTLVLDGAPLAIEDVVQVARAARKVALGEHAKRKLAAARAVVDAATTDGLAHYGINTGFGSLSRVRIDANELRDLQRNLIRSHAAGVGDALPNEIVRAMMLLLAASLSRGCSGVRSSVVELIIAMLNADITPRVPEVGSVGASGDLAPLAHVALALIGEGPVHVGGSMVDAAHALGAAKLTPIQLDAKEGLALINGTHLMAGSGALLVHDARVLFAAAERAAAMSIDACRATDAFLDPRVHAVRGQVGQRECAARIKEHLRGSQILDSHRENDPRVQDPYSLRCTPQVLGAAWDALAYVEQCISRELGAVTDNPLVFADGANDADPIVSAGNFHGMPLAVPLDALAIAIAHVAGISERRVFWMLSAFDKESQLPPYLTPKPGVCSGLMIAQYTAAACCNELIGLATPASVANISTSAGIEDYNSFGPRSAAKARRGIDLARRVIAIEMLCAAEGVERHRPLRSGPGVESAILAIRNDVAPLLSDRSPAPDIEAIAVRIAGSDF